MLDVRWLGFACAFAIVSAAVPTSFAHEIGSPGQAETFLSEPVPNETPILSELRFGGAFEGVELNETVLILPGVVPLDRLHKFTVEAVFGGIDLNVFKWAGSLYPTVGGTISLTGDDSWLYAGVTWQLPILDNFYFEYGMGAAIHNGYLHDAPAGRRNYGCRALIFAQGAFGVNLGDNWTATINLEHGSHATLCGGDNQGFNSVGIKLGYKF